MASAPLAMVGMLVLAYIAHAAFIPGKTTAMMALHLHLHAPFFMVLLESN